MEYNEFQLALDLGDDYEVPVDDGKECSKCSEYLPLEAFSKSSGGNYARPECRSCASELARERRTLKEIHGDPPAGYECPICRCDEDTAKGRGGNAGAWVLDHCHESSDFRGWLCHSCNRALGCFNDDVPRLNRAIRYLEGEI